MCLTVMPSGRPIDGPCGDSYPQGRAWRGATCHGVQAMPPKDTAPGFAMIMQAAAAAGLKPRTQGGNTILGKAERDDVACVANNDPTMAAAIRKARDTLPEFLAIAKNPHGTAEGFAVKV